MAGAGEVAVYSAGVEQFWRFADNILGGVTSGFTEGSVNAQDNSIGVGYYHTFTRFKGGGSNT